jgi:hypothetical protein
LLVAALVLASATPALAVQTSTFGLAPTDGAPALVVRPSGTTRTSVRVSNRTTHSITVDLEAVAASRDSAGTFSYGSPGAGLATAVHLGSAHATLAGGAFQDVEVDIAAPSAPKPVYAAITATSGDGSATSGVRQRLAVIVEVTATAPASDHFQSSPPSSTEGPPTWLVIIAVALVAGTAAGVVASRRRST